MKLKKVLNRKVNDKSYFRYNLTIPTDLVEKLDWKKGTDLDFEVKGKKLEIRKK